MLFDLISICLSVYSSLTVVSIICFVKMNMRTEKDLISFCVIISMNKNKEVHITSFNWVYHALKLKYHKQKTRSVNLEKR
jgi:hypothetical protein